MLFRALKLEGISLVLLINVFIALTGEYYPYFAVLPSFYLDADLHISICYFHLHVFKKYS